MSRFGSVILIMAFLVVVATPCWCQTTQSQQGVDLQSWSTDDEADSSLQSAVYCYVQFRGDLQAKRLQP
jgi:hypothetical protein